MIRVTNLIGTLVQNQTTLDHIIRWTGIVLVILIAISLGRLGADLIWFEPVNNSPAAHSSVAPVLQQTVNPGIGVDSISPALALLFGKSESVVISETVDQQPLQQTSLNLTLKGILADNESNNRLALISAGGGKEQVYRIGQNIEGAEIIRIEARRVVIRRNGANEALDLEVKKLEGMSISPVGPGRDNISSGIRKLNDTDRTITRSTLKQQMNNLPALLQQATAVPHSQGGEQIGFRIVDLKKGSVFEQLGIQQNDIIYAVNGTPVRNAEEALNAYRMIGTTSNFMIGLLRNGQDLKLNLAIQ